MLDAPRQEIREAQISSRTHGIASAADQLRSANLLEKISEAHAFIEHYLFNSEALLAPSPSRNGHSSTSDSPASRTTSSTA